jgi:magnesium transporter
VLGQEHPAATKALGSPSDDGRHHSLASDTTSTHDSGFLHGRGVTSEIVAFITSQALITVRQDDGLDIGAVVERWDESPDLAIMSRGLGMAAPSHRS